MPKNKYFLGILVINARLFYYTYTLFSTLGLTRPSNKRSRNGVDDQQRDSSVPRIIWFKPTDKRVPLIAIPVEQAPTGFIENCDAFENRLFLVSLV